MILYRVGEITYKNNSNIIFEAQNVGYSLILPDPDRVNLKEKLRLYLYEIKNDYYRATYAFLDFKERLLFIDLISINGIGPRVAFNLVNSGWMKTAQNIATGNTEGLIEIPYFNPKLARTVIVELQDKWAKMISDKISKTDLSKGKSYKLNQVRETLKVLGFKKMSIENALDNIEPNDDIDLMIEQAIKLMSQPNEPTTVTTQ
ncbi:Holliday junction branch migration protein RuvA [Mycoplasmopsis opalescens]|uniref:Holliday junction branch migration protein RuvA n=1 Tax=Mycoplasmopsis opalescens TaxID=114886 RepID=UPI0004A737F8|nr:Holliday junction branch migration protein RuvA [Mycoplasmopsis opalescens]